MQRYGKQEENTNSDESNSQVIITLNKRNPHNEARKLDEVREKQMRCLYTIARSLGSNTEELVLMVQVVHQDIMEITQTG